MSVFKWLSAGVVLGGLLLSVSVHATSLFKPQEYRALHADKKAFRIGDAITILILENAQATSRSGAGSNGEFSLVGSAGVDERSWSTGLNLGSGNQDDASTNRNGFVRAQITAKVTGIDKYGALAFQGTQQILINEESQSIKISGTVRPEDIDARNMVPSYRVQDAQISVSGEGEVSDGRKSNVLTRLVRWLGF